MRANLEPFDPRRRRLLASGALALLLPGCLGAPGRDDGVRADPGGGPPDDVVERWRALGKLAARTTGDRKGERNWSGTLDWRQARENFRLRMSGPFGQGAFQVEGRPGEVELTTARGERRSAATPETLFARELGWYLPASALRHWITARARPGVPVKDWRLDAAGRLSSLAQQGWRLDYEYREAPVGSPPEDARGPALPERITLRGEEVVVRIAIRDWRLE